VPLAVGLVLLLGVGDAVSGVEVPFTLLYLIPTGLAAWFHGRRAGQGIAALCMFGGVIAEIVAGHSHALSRLVPEIAWRQVTSLLVFLIVAELLDRLREYAMKEAGDRKEAVAQLRHSERLNGLGKLAAGVAHELATPLNAVVLNAEIIAKDPKKLERTATCARRIVDESEKMTVLVAQLLHFGRRGALAKARTDLRALARRNASMLETLARKHRCRLKVDPREEPLWVHANAIELGQVVTNLVMNAVQATPRGGIVSILCDLVETAEAEREGARVASLSVEDRGSGIAPEHLARVFDPFFTTKSDGQGTGLGLSLSYGIVEEHGGRIRVDSRVGEGSRFTVLLPAERGGVTALESASPQLL